MNIFVPDKPVVEIVVNVDGKPIAAKTNIVPNVKVKVVGPDTVDIGLPFDLGIHTDPVE